MEIPCKDCRLPLGSSPSIARVDRQGVSVIVKTHTADNPVVADITLSTEVGMMGESATCALCDCYCPASHAPRSWCIEDGVTPDHAPAGGSPCGGLLFGTAYNADAHIPTPAMFDFYNGGGCDAAFLGCAEACMHLAGHT